MNNQEELLRYRAISADFTLQHRNLQKIVDSNEDVINHQSKLINKLTEEHQELSSQNTTLSQEIEKMRKASSQQTFDRIVAQNNDLQKKIQDLELLLAKTKVESAAKEQQILLTQLELNRLSTSSQKQLERQRNIKGQNCLSKIKIVRIVENGKPNRGQCVQQKQNYTDNQVKQWIKYLQLRQSSQQVTVSKVKDKCKSIIKNFIPAQLRRLAWPLFIQNKLSLTPTLFNYFQQMKTDQKVIFQIQKDIDRWFTIQGQKNQTFIQDLHEILRIFHCYRPDISYVQGMTYPAGILLMVLDKYKAWQCCCNIMLTNQVIYNLYTFNLQKIALYCRTFEYLLSQNYESVMQKLDSLMLHSQIYLIQWFYTIFSRSFSLSTVFKIWDLLIYHGEAILFRISLSIFQQLRTLIEKLDYDQCIEVIKNFNTKIDEQKLLQSVIDSRLTTQKLRNTFSKVEHLTDSRGDIN